MSIPSAQWLSTNLCASAYSLITPAAVACKFHRLISRDSIRPATNISAGTPLVRQVPPIQSVQYEIAFVQCRIILPRGTRESARGIMINLASTAPNKVLSHKS